MLSLVLRLEAYYGANDQTPRGKAAPADNPASHSTFSITPGRPPRTHKHGANGQPRNGANPTAVLASEIGPATNPLPRKEAETTSQKRRVSFQNYNGLCEKYGKRREDYMKNGRPYWRCSR
jgi:hypothetical protein